MYTKTDFKKHLEELGIKKDGTLLVHSSYKSIGDVDGGPDTVLDSLSEYMEDGLLVLPTHTWSYINHKNPIFYVDESPTCVGHLTERFRKREGVIRSWHPTHSVAALGKDAAEFTKGDEKFDTPCARGSAWGKLLDRKAQIMLLGVDLRRNTFIHGIEEWVDIPGRLTDTHESLYTVLEDGTKISVPSRRHTSTPWSEHFWKVDDYLVELGAMHIGKFGDAEVRVCDTVKTTEVITEMLEVDPELFTDNEPLTSEFKLAFDEKWSKRETTRSL
ncbi:aminoglycoside 3-N-acetyltransferase [Gracilibacillus halotolerans]|uniref:Aminoglycoside N(3)-acetyltransferase n=1 Tax=Gracilibacillus halotolerans TaxID=74386 RepID=A0A841RPD3_9BACI|nr:AAC(3) family N-acetyltransferase [Gracilibacillus halotolerans]MBB6512794.1 aminoglycoside 3-N-acetyltransferase [Gracilibacillus halotolerans]